MGECSKAELCHVVRYHLGWTIVDSVPLRQEYNSVEHLENFGGRLMDRSENRSASVSLTSKKLDELC